MRILIPVDGSVYSRNAINFVAARRQLIGDDLKVDLLNVQDVVPEDYDDDVIFEAVDPYTKAASKKVFEKLGPYIDCSGLKVEKKAIAGPVGDTIVAEAKKNGDDLVVMGTHGRSGFSGLFLGSVSIRVLSKIDRPVLLLRKETPVIKEGLRVGLCVDDLKHSMASASLIAEQIKFFGIDPVIEVIHVKTQEVVDQNAVEPVLKRLADAGLSSKVVELEGIASEEIVKHADGHLDLLVMGSHGYGNFTSAVLGSTTSRVAAKSSLPILVVKA